VKLSASPKNYDLFAGRIKLLGMSLLLGVLSACSGTASDSGGTTPPPTVSSTVAKLSVLTLSDATSNTAKSSVNSDNSDSVTIVATALDSNNVAVPDAAIVFSSDMGELLVQASKTDSSGKIQATFRAGTGNANKANRTEDVSVKSSSGITSIAPIKVTGTTLSAKLAQGSGNTVAAGGTSVLTFLLKDSGGVAIANQGIALSASGTGAVGFSAASVVTDQNGSASVTVTGQSSGAVTISASALGAKASLDMTVTAGASAFGITSPANNSNLGIGVQQQVLVNAPGGATQVVFAVSQGTWVESGTNVYTATVNNGQAMATFVATKSGVSTIDAYNKNKTSERASLALNIGATDASNGRVILQVSPATVTVSNGENKNSTTLVAKVLNGAGDPVFNAPVMFSISKPSGSGESVGPTVVFSDAAGEAKTSFVSGTAVGKVTVAATVIGASPITPGEATVDVGGQAVSIGLGTDSEIVLKPQDANYYLAMTVFVTDTLGNAVNGALVNLSVQPIYFSRGESCSVEQVDVGGVAYDLSFVTENTAETDYLSTLGLAPSGAGKWSALIGSTYVRMASADATDKYSGSIQPSAANAGSVPATVTTGVDGKATFTYVYPKSSALWHVVRIRARSTVAGTEAINDKVFRLLPVKDDVSPTCRLPASPYN
jgi:hypothetical protein